jgi:hypothetical protein
LSPSGPALDSEIEAEADGGGDRQAGIRQDRGLGRRRVQKERKEAGIIVIGGVQDLAVEADSHFAKRPGLVSAQVEAFIGTDADQGKRGEKSYDGKPRPVRGLGAKAQAGSETIASEDVPGVTLILQCGLVWLIQANGRKRRR